MHASTRSSTTGRLPRNFRGSQLLIPTGANEPCRNSHRCKNSTGYDWRSVWHTLCDVPEQSENSNEQAAWIEITEPQFAPPSRWRWWLSGVSSATPRVRF